MNKIYLLGITILGILLLATFLHFTYMDATSYECQIDLPPKPFINELTGEKYYIGGDNFNLEIKCEGGILARFPII